jgi:hypothetical protein
MFFGKHLNIKLVKKNFIIFFNAIIAYDHNLSDILAKLKLHGQSLTFVYQSIMLLL